MWQRVKQFITAYLSDQKQSFGEHPMFYPGRDWKIMLGVFVAIAVIVACVGGYMFMQIRAGTFFQSTSDSATSTELVDIDQNDLADVIDFYEQRRTRFQEIKEEPLEVVDPSK